MKRSTWVVAAVAVLLGEAHADPSFGGSSPRETPFDRGHVSVTAGGGSQSAFGFRYFGAGIGVGYYVLDGLQLGIFGLHEFGNGPRLNKVSPSLEYVAQPLVGSWPVIPYTGAFYNHWFVGDPGSDIDTLGSRAGVLYLSGRIIAGIGIVYEHVLSTCSQDCDSVYPDVTLGFTL
ncbi:MAG TPA: hypothetical protein VHN14_23235 [Kofleriaceae bacterium]|jgi:hypothetical protein|nr:hypothetical protein [Kofleriaceae bacterium]